ncbi:MAG: hypothetical protein GF368_01235 [Candidatus Aenigmarchaeota archaeon]|nr:hypothetical protein [Candidatus Aenigmarchaeota archaeon]
MKKIKFKKKIKRRKFRKPEWLSFKNPYLFTIFCLGLFIGFWLGFFVFAQVHIKVVCQPSGKTLLDTRRSLRHEFTLSTGVAGCERIDLVVSKPKLTEIISRGGRVVTESLEQEPRKQTESVPAPGGAKPVGGESGGGVAGTGIPTREDAPEGTRIITLDVFGICSGKSDVEAEQFQDSRDCLVKDLLPYYVVLEKDEIEFKTSFYEGIGFNETYNITDYIGIFKLFAKDLSTIEGNVKVVKAYGPMAEYFELGDYIIEDIPSPGGGTERVISFPLYVSGDIPETVDWTYLGLYIYMTRDIYYIGDIWFYVD